MNINIQVAVDKTTNDLRSALQGIRALTNEQRSSLHDAIQGAKSATLEVDPDCDWDSYEVVLTCNIMQLIQSGELTV